MAMLVRIKPYDPNRGRLVRRYTAFSTRFDEKRGWYRVGDDVAQYLSTVHQVAGDEDSPLVFDVCTEEQAREIEEADRRRAQERAQAVAPNVARPNDTSTSGLTTADLVPAKSARSEGRAARRG
jgi:hypothetical protein